MQQYCAAAALSATMPNIPPQAEPNLAPQASSSTEPADKEPSSSPISETSPSSETSPNTCPQASTEPVPSTSSSTAIGETDELRRRRLQHFEQQRQ